MPLHQFPKHSQRSAPRTVKDLEGLHTIADPRDNVSGLLYAVRKSLGQMAARTMQGLQAARTSDNQNGERRRTQQGSPVLGPLLL